MDNSIGSGQERLKAKEVTAEIDRQTDLAVLGESGNIVGENGARVGVSREQAGNLGNQALFYGANAQQTVSRNYEQVINIAERDNGYEYREGLLMVGEESKREVAERLAEDRENLKNENHPDIDRDAKIVARSQEERGGIVMKKVRQFLGRSRFEVAELDRWYREQRNDMLLDFEHPRKIGDRN